MLQRYAKLVISEFQNSTTAARPLHIGGHWTNASCVNKSPMRLLCVARFPVCLQISVHSISVETRPTFSYFDNHSFCNALKVSDNDSRMNSVEQHRRHQRSRANVDSTDRIPRPSRQVFGGNWDQMNSEVHIALPLQNVHCSSNDVRQLGRPSSRRLVGSL